MNQTAQFFSTFRNGARIIDYNSFGATVDSVNNIVHTGSQIVDIFTVEGSDECGA